MTLISHAHSSYFMELQNLDATTLKRATYAPNVFLEITGKINNFRFDLPNFLKFRDNIPHKLLRPSQFLEKFIEILKCPTLQK